MCPCVYALSTHAISTEMILQQTSNNVHHISPEITDHNTHGEGGFVNCEPIFEDIMWNTPYIMKKDPEVMQCIIFIFSNLVSRAFSDTRVDFLPDARVHFAVPYPISNACTHVATSAMHVHVKCTSESLQNKRVLLLSVTLPSAALMIPRDSCSRGAD